MDPDLVGRASGVLAAYIELGNALTEGPHGRCVRSAASPRVYDANCVTRVGAAAPDDVDELLAGVDERFRDLPFRCFKLDPLTPAPVEARLALDGATVDEEIQLVLEGALRSEGAATSAVDIRPVTDEEDWASLGRLLRMDHEEIAARRGRPCWEQGVTDEVLAQKRLKAPHVQFFIARADGDDVGFFSSWPGVDGVGKVEDLFTAPVARHRGVATALIHHAVADARRRGAGPVLIGADRADTPRHMYAAMGFRPLMVTRSYLLVRRDRDPST